QITILVELRGRQAWPPAVDLPASDSAAENKHDVGVAMVGAAVAVFANGAPEFRHGHQDYVPHPRSEVSSERGERIAELTEIVGELSLRSALAGMSVPPADVGEGHFQSEM